MKSDSIEQIWEDGFLQKNLVAPKVNNYLNIKSVNIVEGLYNSFRKEVYLNIPLMIGVFLFNIWLDNDNATLWGAICMMPNLLWFFMGKRQLKSIKEINYQSNCKEYLLAVRSKINKIRKYNNRLAVLSIPAILTPMLIFTYYKQQGKNIGEVFGVNYDFPLEWMFMLVPIFTLFAYFVIRIEAKYKIGKYSNIDRMIATMEDLKSLK